MYSRSFENAPDNLSKCNALIGVLFSIGLLNMGSRSGSPTNFSTNQPCSVSSDCDKATVIFGHALPTVQTISRTSVHNLCFHKAIHLVTRQATRFENVNLY